MIATAPTGMVRGRPDLVDLRALPARWRVRRDAEGLPAIPGRRGHVEAHDLATLCVYVTGRGVLPKLLRNLPAGWRRHQVGDAEANLLAPTEDLDRAATIVRAYRRRKLSPEHREALLAGQLRRQNAPSLNSEGHYGGARRGAGRKPKNGTATAAAE